MYVAVKGGEKAIANAHKLTDKKRRGDTDLPEITTAQIAQQLHGAVDRVMNEGNVYDRELASLALKQSGGDLIEAVFLLRAYRTTLPRIAVAKPVNTNKMHIFRRVSATFKDVPGGQILGPTYDYTHRLFDMDLKGDNTPHVQIDTTEIAEPSNGDIEFDYPHVSDYLENDENMFRETDTGAEPRDITVHPLSFPGSRAERLQQMIRGDEGFLVGMAYAVIRGYGSGTHPYVGETRTGECAITLCPEEVGFDITIGDVEMTECEMFSRLHAPEDGSRPKLTRGYGLVVGASERKAMAVAIEDRALRAEEYGGTGDTPPTNIEFMMAHCDNVDADGFVSHLRLPHYVDFQADLNSLYLIQDEIAQRAKNGKK